MLSTKESKLRFTKRIHSLYIKLTRVSKWFIIAHAYRNVRCHIYINTSFNTILIDTIYRECNIIVIYIRIRPFYVSNLSIHTIPVVTVDIGSYITGIFKGSCVSDIISRGNTFFMTFTNRNVDVRRIKWGWNHLIALKYTIG